MVELTRREIAGLLNAVSQTIGTLVSGAKRTNRSAASDKNPEPIEVTGYWVGDMMRIDIKL